MGHLRHANSLRLWQRTLLKHPWLRTLFTLPHAVLAQVGHCKTGFKRRALVALWRPRAATPDQPNLF